MSRVLEMGAGTSDDEFAGQVIERSAVVIRGIPKDQSEARPGRPHYVYEYPDIATPWMELVLEPDGTTTFEAGPPEHLSLEAFYVKFSPFELRKASRKVRASHGA